MLAWTREVAEGMEKSGKSLKYIQEESKQDLTMGQSEKAGGWEVVHLPASEGF